MDVQLVSSAINQVFDSNLTTLSCSIIGLVTPDMLETITWGTYIFFAAFCLLALAFTFFCIPETRGKVCSATLFSRADRFVHGRLTMLTISNRHSKIWISFSVTRPLTKKRNASSALKPSYAGHRLKKMISSSRLVPMWN